MKRWVSIAVLTAALGVAGCSKGEGGSDAADASGPVKREAGNWKTEVKLVKFEMPGMPPDMKDSMAKSMAGAANTEQCLTEEQASKEDVAAEMSKATSAGGQCTWSKKEIAGGKIDIAGTCSAAGQESHIAMTGTIAAKRTDMTVSTKGKAPTGSGDMEMVMQVTSTNTGPCKAS